MALVPGKYKARAMDCGLGYAGTGSEQVGVLFEVTEGDSLGEVMTWYGSFSEKAAEYTIKGLRACGWRGDDLSTLSVSDLTDEVILVVQAKKDDPNKVEIRFINALGSGIAMKNRMEDGQKADFAARMRGLCMAIPAGAPAKPNGTPRPAAPPPVRRETGHAPATQAAPPPDRFDDGSPVPNDDDLPF